MDEEGSVSSVPFIVLLDEPARAFTACLDGAWGTVGVVGRVLGGLPSGLWQDLEQSEYYHSITLQG